MLEMVVIALKGIFDQLNLVQTSSLLPFVTALALVTKIISTKSLELTFSEQITTGVNHWQALTYDILSRLGYFPKNFSR